MTLRTDQCLGLEALQFFFNLMKMLRYKLEKENKDLTFGDMSELTGLKNREIKALTLRFCSPWIVSFTLAEVGLALGVKGPRVRCILDRAIRKLNKFIEVNGRPDD